MLMAGAEKTPIARTTGHDGQQQKHGRTFTPSRHPGSALFC
jgi:hypothetical protein